jgi:ABC-2 type transport system permease protein
VRLRFFKILLAVAWTAGAAIALLGFGFSQTIVSGGWLDKLAGAFGPRGQAVASTIGALVLLYPDVCIGGFFTVVFWLHSFVGLWLSLIALTGVIPRLITRDRASNALIVYLSRPLTSTDYLLGKLGIIVGVLVAVWTGPLLFGWVLSVGFAPDLEFIRHSLAPLLDALLFHGIALVTLAAIALGVSAVSRTSRSTILLWIGLWVILGFFTVDRRAPVWLQRTSFTNNLTQVRSGILRPDEALITAGEVLPLTNRQLAANLTRAGTKVQPAGFSGALLSLGAFVALSSVVFLRRIRPE